MKKVISVLLTFIMVMSLVAVSGTTVFAESSNLINETLQEQLDAIGDDDSISVWIWIYSKIDIKEIEQQALVETGLVGEELDTTEEIDAFQKVRTRLISEYYTAENKAVLDKIGVAQENILFLSTLTPSFIVTLTKTQVYEVAQMEEIGSIDYYEDTPAEEPWDPPIEPTPKFLYKDKFEEYVNVPEYDPKVDEYDWGYYYDYDEIYYHENAASGEVDWVLISATVELPPDPWDIIGAVNIGNRVLKWWRPGAGILPFGLAVYDVEADTVRGIESANSYYYDGLAEAVDELGLGLPVGDADGDGELTIFDATEIQRALAELCDFRDDDYIDTYPSYNDNLSYITDFNRDGVRSIVDATAIQRKIAELDEPVVNDEMVTVAIPKEQQWIPQEAISLPFEEIYNEEQLYHHIYKGSNTLGSVDTFAIVKSKEQYYSLFNEDAPVFEDEFFESKWLLISCLSMNGNGGYIRTADIAKLGNTLYSQLEVFVSASTTPPPPIMRWSLSMIAIDKKYLANVTDIVRVE